MHTNYIGGFGKACREHGVLGGDLPNNRLAPPPLGLMPPTFGVGAPPTFWIGAPLLGVGAPVPEITVLPQVRIVLILLWLCDLELVRMWRGIDNSWSYVVLEMDH